MAKEVIFVFLSPHVKPLARLIRCRKSRRFQKELPAHVDPAIDRCSLGAEIRRRMVPGSSVGRAFGC